MPKDYETNDAAVELDAPSRPVVTPRRWIGLLLRILLWIVVLLAAVVAAFFAAYVISGEFDSFRAMLEWIWGNLLG
jgi:ABC-type transporter Mla maintaining outer membrane lipid asymmetry permease subunit MlaE